MEHGYPLLLLPSATLAVALVLAALAIGARRAIALENQQMLAWAPWLALIGVGIAWLGAAQAVLALGARTDAQAVQTIETRLGTRHLWLGLDASADGALALACLLIASVALSFVLDVVARSTFTREETVSMAAIALTAAGALAMLTLRSVPLVLFGFVLMGIGRRLALGAWQVATYEQVTRDRLADLAFLAAFAVVAPSLPSVDLRTLQAAALPGEISVLRATLDTPLGALPRSELAAALMLVAVVARMELMGGDGRELQADARGLHRRAAIWLAPVAASAISLLATVFFFQRIEGLWILAPSVQVFAAVTGVVALVVAAARLSGARILPSGRVSSTTQALLGLHAAGATLALGFSDFTTASALVCCGVVGAMMLSHAWQPSIEIVADDHWSRARVGGLRARQLLTVIALLVLCGPAPLPGGWAWAMLVVTCLAHLSLAAPWIHALAGLALVLAIWSLSVATGRAIASRRDAQRKSDAGTAASRDAASGPTVVDESRASLSWAWLVVGAGLGYALLPSQPLASMQSLFHALASTSSKLAAKATGDLAIGPRPELQEATSSLNGLPGAALAGLGVLVLLVMFVAAGRAEKPEGLAPWHRWVDESWYAVHTVRAELWLGASRAIRDGAEGWVTQESQRTSLWGFDTVTERLRRFGAGVRGPMIGVWIVVCVMLGWLYLKPSVSRLTPDGLFGFGGLTPGLRGVDDPGQRRKAKRSRELEAKKSEGDGTAEGADVDPATPQAVDVPATPEEVLR